MPWRRAPGQAGNHSTDAIDQVLQVLADRLGVAEEVVALEQAVEKRLLPCASHLAELEGPKLGQAGTQWCGIDEPWDRLPTLRFTAGQRVRVDLANRRQLDMPRPVKLQHQPAAHHIPQRPIRLAPVPRLAQLLRQNPPARPGMLRDESADEHYVAGSDRPAPVF